MIGPYSRGDKVVVIDAAGSRAPMFSLGTELTIKNIELVRDRLHGGHRKDVTFLTFQETFPIGLYSFRVGHKDADPN